MVASSGLSAQLGVAEESTYGTYEVPTVFDEFVNESLKASITRVESNGIRNGRSIRHRWASGTQKAEGGIEMELGNETAGFWLKQCFGGIATTGASDPYTHTFTPGSLDGTSFTAQITRPDIAGTERVFSYLGSKVKSWELSSAIDEYLKLAVDVWSQREDTSQSAAVASYSDAPPFTHINSWVEIGGTELPVMSWSLKGDNGLAVDRFKHRDIASLAGGFGQEPLMSGRRTFEGSLALDFDFTQYSNFKNGTELALVIECYRGASDTLTITTNARYDGETPNVGGDELLSHTIPFVVVGTPGGTDADAITAVLLNATASY